MTERVVPKEVANGVYALIQDGGGFNGGCVVGDDGVLAVEAFTAPSIAVEALAAIRRVTPKPVRWLVLTHHHWDHSFGAERFLPAAVLGHRECRDDLIEKWEVSLASAAAYETSLAGEFPLLKRVVPDVVFSERLTLHVGQYRVELYYFGRAHTKGDIFIHLPESRVLFAGDVVGDRTVPWTQDGYLGSWIGVLERVRSLDASVVVPGHGRLGDKRLIEGTRSFISDLQAQARQAFKAGRTAEEALRGLDLRQYSDWEGVADLSTPIRRLYAEFRGEL